MEQQSAQILGAAPEDRDEFEEWLRPLLPAAWLFVCRFAPAHHREDIYQSTLLAAWSKRKSYDAGRSAPKTWLLLLAADQCRKSRRRLLRPIAAPLAVVADTDLTIDVQRAIAALPRRQRVGVELFYVMDLSVAECALIMECSVGTVKSTLSDARRALRLLLETRP